MQNLLSVLLALALMALNGFFVAAEFGMVRLCQTPIRAIAKRHVPSGRILAKVHGQLDGYVSACQLCITLAQMARAGSASQPSPSRRSG